MLGKLKDAYADLTREDGTGAKPDGRLYALVMPMPLYASYLEIYIMTATFAAKLEEVMDHPEHKLLLEDAKRLGYNVPGEERFREKLERLKRTLDSFEPHDIRHGGNGAVHVSGEMAKGFVMTAILGCDLVNDVFLCLRDTDYLRVYGKLKKLGAAYTGPVSLQEAVNTWQSLVRGHAANVTHDVKRGLPLGWIQSVSPWRRNER